MASIFTKIVNGELPCHKVAENDQFLAFMDITPVREGHVLVIPKYRNGLTRLSKATSDQSEMLGKLLLTAAEIARDESLGFGGDGTRIFINDAAAGRWNRRCQKLKVSVGSRFHLRAVGRHQHMEA